MKYEIVEINFDLNCTTTKKRTEIWTIDLKKNLNLKNLSSAGKKTARLLLARACDSYVPYVRCVGWKPRLSHATCRRDTPGITGNIHSVIQADERADC